MFNWTVTFSDANGNSEEISVWAMQAAQAFHRAKMGLTMKIEDVVKFSAETISE